MSASAKMGTVSRQFGAPMAAGVSESVGMPVGSAPMGMGPYGASGYVAPAGAIPPLPWQGSPSGPASTNLNYQPKPMVGGKSAPAAKKKFSGIWIVLLIGIFGFRAYNATNTRSTPARYTPSPSYNYGNGNSSYNYNFKPSHVPTAPSITTPPSFTTPPTINVPTSKPPGYIYPGNNNGTNRTTTPNGVNNIPGRYNSGSPFPKSTGNNSTGVNRTGGPQSQVTPMPNFNFSGTARSPDNTAGNPSNVDWPTITNSLNRRPDGILPNTQYVPERQSETPVR